jgi:phage terminase large subunit-like protein
MPSAEIIADLSRDELISLATKKRELEEAVIANPARFFQPAVSGDQRSFMTNANPHVQGLYFFAANKTGKTTGGAIACGEFAEGKPIWEIESRSHIPNPWLSPRPKRLCFFCEDFSTHEETIVPTYATWMKAYIREIVKGPSGNLQRIIHKNGSIVYLRTYDQGYEKAEGKDYDLVWTDEPPPRDIYTAIFRGLVATKGRLLITATLLSQAWLYQESLQPFVKIYEATMYDNNWLDSSARDNFAAMLDPSERDIRILGKASSLSGRIYGAFRDDYPFVIPAKGIPWDPIRDDPWPIILVVDPHERRPLYCGWAYITPDNGLLWFDWSRIPSGSITDIFAKITEVEKSHTHRAACVVLDPNRGIAKQLGGKTWKDTFEEHEFQVILGSDDIAHGHEVVREFLRHEIDKPPRMQWMDTCRGKDGPIFSLTMYTWEDWSKGSRFEKNPKEKPQEKYKDYADVTRYAAVALYDNLISFDSLTGGYEEIDMMPSRVSNPYLR